MGGAALGPYDALRRIAYLLERSRAGTYRVKAFRSAAITVLETDPAELRSRAAAGTLTDLPGIGPSTEAVIRQALEGELPEYLTSMEDKATEPLVVGGLEVRAALRGDLHSHSDWSDGGSPIQEMVVTAMDLGHDYLVLTDHSPRLTIASGLSPARLRAQLEQVATLNAALKSAGTTFRVLTGIEVDILSDGGLDQTSAIDHADAVGALDRRQAVRDDQDCSPGADLAHVGHHRIFRFVVQGAGRFIQDDDARVVDQGPGDRKALSLSARKIRPMLLDQRVVLIRQFEDEIMGGGQLCRCDDAIDGHAGIAYGDVLAYRATEEEILLEHDTDLTSQPVGIDHGQIDAVD